MLFVLGSGYPPYALHSGFGIPGKICSEELVLPQNWSFSPFGLILGSTSPVILVGQGQWGVEGSKSVALIFSPKKDLGFVQFSSDVWFVYWEDRQWKWFSSHKVYDGDIGFLTM